MGGTGFWVGEGGAGRPISKKNLQTKVTGCGEAAGAWSPGEWLGGGVSGKQDEGIHVVLRMMAHGCGRIR